MIEKNAIRKDGCLSLFLKYGHKKISYIHMYEFKRKR